MKYGDIGYLNGAGVCMLINPDWIKKGMSVKPFKADSDKVYFLPIKPSPIIAALKSQVKIMWSEVPSMEDLDEALKQAQRAEVPREYVHFDVAALVTRRDMRAIGTAIRYSQIPAARGNALAKDVYSAAVCNLASIHVYRELEENGKLGHLRHLLTKKDKQNEREKLMGESAAYMQSRGDELREIAREEEKAELLALIEDVDIEKDGAPEAETEQEVAPEKLQKAQKPEKTDEELLAELEVQMAIVKAAAKKAKHTAFSLTPHNEAVEQVVALYEAEHINFRSAVVLLRHAFENKDDAQGTVDLINDHNPPSKGPIEATSLRKQLQAAITQATGAGNDNFALRRHLEGINPRKFKFA